MTKHLCLAALSAVFVFGGYEQSAVAAPEKKDNPSVAKNDGTPGNGKGNQGNGVGNGGPATPTKPRGRR